MKINLKRVAMILLVVIALLALAIPVFAEIDSWFHVAPQEPHLPYQREKHSS